MSTPSQEIDMSPGERARRAIAVPILAFLDARPIDVTDATRGLELPPSSNALNAVGGWHAGALATALEVAAYLALVRDLAPNEEAITHAFTASYVAPIPPNATLEATGEVVRRGRSIAFVTSKLQADHLTVAIANVTKSIRST